MQRESGTCEAHSDIPIFLYNRRVKKIQGALACVEATPQVCECVCAWHGVWHLQSAVKEAVSHLFGSSNFLILFIYLFLFLLSRVFFLYFSFISI